MSPLDESEDEGKMEENTNPHIDYQVMPEAGTHPFPGDNSPQLNSQRPYRHPEMHQQFTNPYAGSAAIYNVQYAQPQQANCSYNNFYWQGSSCPPPGSQGRFFATTPGFGPPQPMMYPPGHLANNAGYPQQYPSWHSMSSAESSGSLGSSGRSGSGSSTSPSRKGRRAKEKKQTFASRQANYDVSMTLHQIKGRVARVAKDQDGSRFIQQRLAFADGTEIQLVFDEAVAAIEELWNDVYGNFIIQKLLEFGTCDMKEAIGKRLHSDAISLSTRVYGCRVIQKAFDELSKREVADLVSTFKGNVLLCLRNHNGNHVIQKAIKMISTMAAEARENGEDDLCAFFISCLDPIVDEIIASVEDLSQHPYGCRSVQRLVEYCLEPQRTKVLDSIIACRKSLLEHQYGNYVVQKVLVHGRQSDRDAIFESITSHNSAVKFSKQKQASNVVEAILRLGSASQREQIVREMLNCLCLDQNNDTESAVVSMAKDPYANYVVKTALEVLEESDQRDELYSELLANLAELEKVSFAKHIVAKIKTYEPTQKAEDGYQDLHEQSVE